MYRHFSLKLAALLAAGVAFATDVRAGEAARLEERIHQLQTKLDDLEAQRSKVLQQEVEKYLEEGAAWKSASGEEGFAPAIRVSARFLAIHQSVLGLETTTANQLTTEESGAHAVDGLIDLDFDFAVSDGIDIFVHTTANAGANGFPTSFDTFTTAQEGTGDPANPANTVTLPQRTLSGFTDGIGVNGAQPVTDRGLRVHEGGFRWKRASGGATWGLEAGKLDPRRHFLNNAFAEDEQTQFVNNVFDDSAAILWLTDATYREVFGLMIWTTFGSRKNVTVRVGWFNEPGQFWDRGQLLAELHWRAEVAGRDMNLRLTGFYDNYAHEISPTVFDPTNAANVLAQGRISDGYAGGGVSWDLLVTDNIGVWARFVGNSKDVNPIDWDAAFGLHFAGLFGRPDDVLGIGVGLIKADDTHPQFFLPGTAAAGQKLPNDMETVFEVYYLWAAEEGKLQISPHVMIVNDPGGGGVPWADDLLIILGLRVHVPF